MLHNYEKFLANQSWTIYKGVVSCKNTYGYPLNSGFEQQIQHHDVDSDIDFEVLQMEVEWHDIALVQTQTL